MINFEYKVIPQETSQATLDFLTNRPFLSAMFFMMKVSCIILCIMFAFAAYNKSARTQDLAVVIMAIGWLLFYKPINRYLIKSSLKAASVNDTTNTCKIDDKSIYCNLANRYPLNIEWKRLKYLLKNKDGYIVPLTGLGNGGKFIWLPYRAFKPQGLEQEFLSLAGQFKLKIKKI